MDFKIGDMIIINDDSKRYFKVTVHSTIFVVLNKHTNPNFLYVYHLGEQTDSETFIAKNHFQLATELEIKKYKIKNLF
jgi:hypothetical protein